MSRSRGKIKGHLLFQRRKLKRQGPTDLDNVWLLCITPRPGAGPACGGILGAENFTKGEHVDDASLVYNCLDSQLMVWISRMGIVQGDV